MKDFMNDFLNSIENMVNKETTKTLLSSLADFQSELKNENIKKEIIDDFNFKILFLIYIKHYKLENIFGMKTGDET
jgi:nucleoid-associated protein YejK